MKQIVKLPKLSTPAPAGTTPLVHPVVALPTVTPTAPSSRSPSKVKVTGSVGTPASTSSKKTIAKGKLPGSTASKTVKTPKKQKLNPSKPLPPGSQPPLLILKKVDTASEVRNQGASLPGSSNADPDTSLLTPKDSSDEDEEEWTALQTRLKKETAISSPYALPESHPSSVQHKVPSNAMQGVEETPKPLHSTKYRRFTWYLMWDEPPSPVMAELPNGYDWQCIQL
eukprot:scaffold99001_cov40-Attheya_sp.AAC.1